MFVTSGGTGLASVCGHVRVELGHAEHVDHQHRVVRRDRAARLADDVRVRDLVGVADLLDRVDDVVRVLLHRVVHRRREVGLRAVVVDAETAADVEVRQALRAELVAARQNSRPASRSAFLTLLIALICEPRWKCSSFKRLELAPGLELARPPRPSRRPTGRTSRSRRRTAPSARRRATTAARGCRAPA